MITLLENEFVSKRCWIADMVAIAESTPGPIPGSAAATVGVCM